MKSVNRGKVMSMMLRVAMVGLFVYNAVYGVCANAAVDDMEINRDRGMFDRDKVLKYNENPLGCSEKVLDVIKNLDVKDIATYPDPDCMELRKRLGDIHDVPVENIVVSSGLHRLMHDAIMVLYMPSSMEGSEFLTHELAYGKFKYALDKIEGRKYVAVPNTLTDTGYGIDLRLILRAVTADTKAVMIDNPGNPIGGFVPLADIRKLREKLPKDVVLIIDEVYYDFANYEAAHRGYGTAMDILKEDPKSNMIVLRSFSKAYGLAGVRLGYGIFSSAELARKVNAFKMQFDVNSISLKVAMSALDDQDHVQKNVIANKTAKNIFVNSVRENSKRIKVYDTVTNFILLELPNTKLAVALEAFLADQGFLVRKFGGPQHVRISVGLESVMQEAADAVNEFCANNGCAK